MDDPVAMRLELVPIGVSDVDRAKDFYLRAGFGNLVDVEPRPGMRVVQLTPPGSSCAIVFGTGMGALTDMAPGGVQGLHLVVDDISLARRGLRDRGVDVGEVEDNGGVLYASFTDPDGTLWLLQQWPATSGSTLPG